MPTGASDPARTAAFLYGRGVFTTVAVRDSAPLLWAKHWARLATDAAKLGIDLTGFDEQTLRTALDRAIEDEHVVDGRVRLTFSDEAMTQIWDPVGSASTKLSIIAGPLREIRRDLRLTISPHLLNSTSPLAGVKSCNYLDHLMAHDEAKARGFDEAVRLNERGEIASACMANLFWLEGDNVYTPSLETGCLAGTTREFVLERLKCEQVEREIEAVRGADAVFLTSAGLGVVRVTELDGRKLVGKDHPILTLMKREHY